MGRHNPILTFLACLAISMGNVSTASANFEWSFSSNDISNCIHDCGSINSLSHGNTHRFSSTDPGLSVNVNAWSSTADVSGEDRIENAHLTLWSGGLGVRNRENDWNSPHHSVDNNGNPIEGDLGDADGVLFAFGKPTQLNSVGIGWWYDDSDISVLAYTGNGAPASLEDQRYSELVNAGDAWELVGHYTDLGGAPTDINSANIVSSLWLITAYNRDLGGNQNISMGNDFFKLNYLSGTVSQPEPDPDVDPVPAPNVIFMLALGLIGMHFKNNRDKNFARAST